MTPKVTSPPPAGTDDSPFGRPGLMARLWPFAAVAVLAEASLALPPASHDWPAVTISLVLLVATALEFALPWRRMPDWTHVLVPLTYSGSALALTIAGGNVSGVGIVVLTPLIWTALFHRRWESAWVVAAIVVIEASLSVAQSAGNSVTARRVLLWGALGALLAIATHGLRDRIGRARQETARLQEQLTEVKLLEDRDRLAAELQGSVVKHIFAAALGLSGVASLTADTEVRRRMESSVTDLDEAIRLLRHAVFALDGQQGDLGLRQLVLDVCAGMSPAPEITFAGPVDRVLPSAAAPQFLDLLRVSLGLLGGKGTRTSIGIEAGERLTVSITGCGPRAQENGFSSLRDEAGLAGVPLEIEPLPGGTRFTWSVPLGGRTCAGG